MRAPAMWLLSSSRHPDRPGQPRRPRPRGPHASTRIRPPGSPPACAGTHALLREGRVGPVVGQAVGTNRDGEFEGLACHQAARTDRGRGRRGRRCSGGTGPRRCASGQVQGGVSVRQRPFSGRVLTSSAGSATAPPYRHLHGGRGAHGPAAPRRGRRCSGGTGPRRCAGTSRGGVSSVRQRPPSGRVLM